MARTWLGLSAVLSRIGTAAHWLSRAGIDATCVDTFIEGIEEERFAGADLVGISVQLFQAIPPAVKIAQAARRASPDARIVMWGQHANIHAERLVGAHCDAIIRGDWEPAVVALARQAAGETARLPSDIRGVLASGNIIASAGPELVGRDAMIEIVLARLEQLRRTEQAADMVGSIAWSHGRRRV